MAFEIYKGKRSTEVVASVVGKAENSLVISVKPADFGRQGFTNTRIPRGF